MMQTRRWLIGALALLMVAGTCFAEDAEPAKFYKLEFVVKEVDGSKVINSRTYRTMISRDSQVQIRAGSKVPYVSERGGSNGTRYEQIDIGVNIDAKVLKEFTDKLEFLFKLEISSVAKDPDAQSHTNPIIRQNSWSSSAVVPFHKPTVVLASEDADSQTQTQLEVTATVVP